MSEDDRPWMAGSLNRVTWRELLAHAREYDAELRFIEIDGVPTPHLIRWNMGNPLWVVLPSNFDESTSADEKVGMFRADNICRRLEIPCPWPPIL